MTFDLLLKGGHLIDPANDIDAARDLAITAGKRTLGAIRLLRTAQPKKCPALDLIGGRRYQRRAESGYQRRKVIQVHAE